MATAKVLACKAPPANFDCIVMVTFTVELTEFDRPVEVTRGVKKGSDEKWKHYPVLDVLAPARIKLYDVPLCQGDKGNFYLQLPNITIPREIVQGIIEEAMMMDTPVNPASAAKPAA